MPHAFLFREQAIANDAVSVAAPALINRLSTIPEREPGWPNADTRVQKLYVFLRFLRFLKSEKEPGWPNADTRVQKHCVF